MMAQEAVAIFAHSSQVQAVAMLYSFITIIVKLYPSDLCECDVIQFKYQCFGKILASLNFVLLNSCLLLNVLIYFSLTFGHWFALLASEQELSVDLFLNETNPHYQELGYLIYPH